MKKIENVTADEKKLLVSIMESATPQTRTTIKDIRQIDKICTMIESSENSLDFEDSDYSYMKQRINEFAGWIPKGRKEVLALADKLGL